MGLDMYLEGRIFLWGNWQHPDRDEKRDGFKVKNVTLELGYWRKHPNLHGYIVKEFADGVDECQEIPLTQENIMQIIDAISNKDLPTTRGFFFGASDGSEDAESIVIFEKALEWLRNATPPKQQPAEPLGDSGLVAMMVKPEDFTAAKESRDVVYRASW